MTFKALSDVDFIDLYLGEDYAEIKGLVGAANFLIPVPDDLNDDVQALRNLCENKHQETGRNEFSCFYDGRLYRATVLKDIFGRSDNLVLRQTPASVPQFEDIPLSTPLRKSIEMPGAAGLVLIAGEMGAGKTTTAASILRHRIAITGNLGVAIEDPVETLLQGRHGNGRCIQLEVRENEGYANATRKAYRMGASAFLLGEIRDSATAHEVLKASLSMFVVSTIHASTLTEALKRYVMFCEEVSLSAKANVASTLFVLAHQKMRVNSENNKRQVDITGFNLRNTPAAKTIQAKIAGGQFMLDDLFENYTYEFKG
ncbi:Flp pilus assembly complex ATPase component TadA [Cronobacter sakazakii]|uniref:ATPase, T2SS/T4P/T4SS family n=1 Tax=Cronobacter sakazakii TaxID=28141 RepID=UPI002938BB8B|nr:ATPase, T2SS/T4P/T4SS family [Cronobacter sakazakii]EKS1073438.1 Flp pilus assembly complex ATPase component TadA [Cronobacter sakazakii]EKS1087116.1 Flp pilus assembly complex ATPase component TadA [Cronobacter sakazakii]ELQ5973792.1 Flp pilus assembly complex ATPase component TadA [Cronobacter sakazakii]ELQ6034812.1 Flp pilus assembly complex ATPase component TadA [Cronobacter sakazakii]ELQ6043527.1 Flp pilus assembly complex ATPase component TadA [Cronobacter sakazakii]